MRKNLLTTSGFKPTTFQLISSCLGITFLIGICLSLIKRFALIDSVIASLAALHFQDLLFSESSAIELKQVSGQPPSPPTLKKGVLPRSALKLKNITRLSYPEPVPLGTTLLVDGHWVTIRHGHLLMRFKLGLLGTTCLLNTTIIYPKRVHLENLLGAVKQSGAYICNFWNVYRP